MNPPLVRMAAALPVLAVGAKTDWRHDIETVTERTEFNVGDDFVTANGARSFCLFTLARWGTIPLSLLGAWICFMWARDLYGVSAGVAAAALWCFSPNIVAYSSLIIPDAGATALGLAVSFLFWKWLRAATWSATISCGAVLGLAELTKTTWLTLFPLWAALALFWWRFDARQDKRRGAGSAPMGAAASEGELPQSRSRRIAQSATITLLAVYVINVGYGFEGSGRRLRDYVFVSRLFSGKPASEHPYGEFGNRFKTSWLGALPVPLPVQYVAGIDVQRRDFEITKPSYLRGRWQERGWWYYYLYALGVKVPLGTWLLMLVATATRIAAATTVWRRRASTIAAPAGWVGGADWRDELVLLAPAFAVLLLVSSQTGFSRHVRYVLPIFPYLFIWASYLFRDGWLGPPRRVHNEPPWRALLRKLTWTLAPLAMGWSVGSSLWHYPHSMSYFNELADGPRGGHAHLIDSNIDWGQDLLLLKRWLDARPPLRPLKLAYYGAVDPTLAGIEYTLPPKGLRSGSGLAAHSAAPTRLEPGWYAVSVNILRGFQNHLPNGRGGHELAEQGCYSYFLDFQPVAMVGYSIYIYRVAAPVTRE